MELAGRDTFRGSRGDAFLTRLAHVRFSRFITKSFRFERPRINRIDFVTKRALYAHGLTFLFVDYSMISGEKSRERGL